MVVILTPIVLMVVGIPGYIYIYIAEASTNFSRQMNKDPSRLKEHDRNQVCLGFTFNHSVVHDFFQQKDHRLLGFSGISLYLFFKKKAAILDHHNCLEEQEVFDGRNPTKSPLLQMKPY